MWNFEIVIFLFLIFIFFYFYFYFNPIHGSFFGYVLGCAHLCNLVSLSHLQILVKSSQKHQSFFKDNYRSLSVWHCMYDFIFIMWWWPWSLSSFQTLQKFTWKTTKWMKLTRSSFLWTITWMKLKHTNDICHYMRN